MADLRTRFIEDYAGGLLNIARQELSSTGEVLAQDGFIDNITLFVEDGRGIKSGLKLGSSLVECIDPVTELGVLNVRSADRTYAKIRELKAFATAIASAQGALSESVADSFANLEGAFEELEGDVQSYQGQLSELVDNTNLNISNLSGKVDNLTESVIGSQQDITTLSDRIKALEDLTQNVNIATTEKAVSGNTVTLDNSASGTINISGARYYAVTKVSTNVPAWVTLYTGATSRGSDTRTQGTEPGLNSGVVLDVVTTSDELEHEILPMVIGRSDDNIFYVRAVNKSGSPVSVKVTIDYAPI